MTRPSVLTVLVTLGLTACSYHPTPVPITGAQEDLYRLAGEWEGEYTFDRSERSGMIHFRLDDDGVMAEGDVLMIAQPRPGAEPANVERSPWQAAASRTELLHITFIQAAGGTVTGSLDPYRDPECGCILRTRFHGTVGDDAIEGTFSTRHVDCDITEYGHWKVSRK